MKVNKKWKREKQSSTRPSGCIVEHRETKYARDCIGRAITIERHFNYNGSGPTAFGGAKEWPVLTICIAFEENAFKERDRIAELMKKFINENM